MAKDKSRRGRPLKPAAEGQKSQVGLMLTAEMKQRLADEAVRTGRSMGETAEHRLIVSYAKTDLLPEIMGLAYGRQTAGVLRLLGMALHRLETQKMLSDVRSAADWLGHPGNFHMACIAIAQVLDALRPAGDIAQRDDVESLGQGEAKTTISSLKEARSPEMHSIAADLGHLFVMLKEKV